MDDAAAALRDEYCSNCRDYKGMTTCEADDCNERYCAFCDFDNHADHPYYPIQD